MSVLTGFLGSGKTTLLSPCAGSPGPADTAVIINEFGAIGLDHLLMEAAVQEVVELPNGCTCCAVRQDLADTLYRLLRSRARRRTAAVPSHCAGDQRPRRSRAHPLHALGRCVSRGVAAARPGRDDDRHDRRRRRRWIAFPRPPRRPPWPTCCCSPRPTWRRPPPTCWQRLAALNPIASDRGRAATRCGRGAVRRLAPTPLPRPRLAPTAVHAHGIRRSVGALAPSDDAGWISPWRWAGWRASAARICCA